MDEIHKKLPILNIIGHEFRIMIIQTFHKIKRNKKNNIEFNIILGNST
jgi:hypothetical protein